MLLRSSEKTAEKVMHSIFYSTLQLAFLLQLQKKCGLLNSIPDFKQVKMQQMNIGNEKTRKKELK